MQPIVPTIKGRGTAWNPPNRFQPLDIAPDADALDADEQPAPSTVFYHDFTRTIIATNDSPDVSFDASINPYRGCEHGCIYCFARPTHEYLDWSAGLDFETKILVKQNAPDLLRAELASPKWKPRVLGMSGVTDCYQPVERKLQLTRRCLEVLVEFRNPVAVITKNHLVTRDIDLLSELASHDAAMACVSVTTLDAQLARDLEPRASSPNRRIDAISKLSRAGVPVCVLVAPLIPGLNDHEMPAILQACADAGARHAGYVPLRLPHAVAPLFVDWLSRHRPDRKEKILNKIRSLRGGKLYDSTWHTRMSGTGILADQFSQMFEIAKRKAGLDQRRANLSTAAFRRPGERQMQLW